MESLEPMDQHRAVRFVEDIAAHLDNTVRPDADQVPVERCVVELAQGNPVGHHRRAERVRIGHDVRGFEEFVTPQSTHGTVMLVRPHDALPELALMEPLPEQARGVATAQVRRFVLDADRAEGREPSLVDADGERQSRRIVADDEDGPLGGVEPRHDAVEVHRVAPGAASPGAGRYSRDVWGPCRDTGIAAGRPGRTRRTYGRDSPRTTGTVVMLRGNACRSWA